MTDMIPDRGPSVNERFTASPDPRSPAGADPVPMTRYGKASTPGKRNSSKRWMTASWWPRSYRRSMKRGSARRLK